MKNIKILRFYDPHDTVVSATKLRTTMRERAGSSHGTLTQLLTDITSDTPIGVRAELGNPETIKRSLRREHAKHLPKNPNSVGGLVLEDEWTKTSDGDQFMIYDNGVDSSNRMLVFGTDEGLRHLASSTTWFLDGTFNVAPSLFTQRDLCDSCTTRQLFCHLCLRVPDQQEPVDI